MFFICLSHPQILRSEMSTVLIWIHLVNAWVIVPKKKRKLLGKLAAENESHLM